MKRLLCLLAALCLLTGCAAPAGQTPPADEAPANESQTPTDDVAPEDESSPVAPTDDSPPVLTCGDYAMTSAQFQYFFGHQYAAILDAYGDSAFDPSKDLAGQPYDENQTWADFLTDQALTLAEQTERLCLAAQAADFGPVEFETPTDEYARSQGYADAQAMLEAHYGEGANLEGYSAFARDMSVSAAYTARLSAGNEHTDAEIEAYYDANADSYATVFHLPKNDDRPLDVRIIRFYPNDLDSEADWAAAEARAKAAEAEFQKDPTDGAFAALADKYTEDFKAPEGGLYEALYPGGEGALAEWLFPEDAPRAQGDTALLRETDAWALCYGSARGDRPCWQCAAEQDLRRDDYLAALDELRKTWVFQRHPENIDLRVPTAHNAESDLHEGIEAVG